jgi:DNA-binding response OmpR family regulator
MTEDNITVLVVDDDRGIADLYTTWLDMEYDVRTAYGGEEALEEVDETVDAVVLDRRMPEVSGDEVLEGIRERSLPCRVVMVTAVDPDFDILEMPFDQYLTKPVMREDLMDIVESLLDRDTGDSTLREYHALVSKKDILEAEKTRSELRHSEAYTDLVERIEELADEVDRSPPDTGVGAGG